MAVSSLIAAGGGKTAFRTSLTGGTSWTVPAGVTYINVTLYGGGGGGGGSDANNPPNFIPTFGHGGQVVSSTLTTTPGASISYSIGAGGTAGTGNPAAAPGAGGTTTFTGATSASGGNRGSGMNVDSGLAGPVGQSAGNGGGASRASNYGAGGAGGSGKIDIEYWV